MSRGNIKTEILEAARRLFNERGYNEVTMRDVAEAVGISVGNLTYHYKRKELLIEAAVVERRREYKIPHVPRTLEELNRMFSYMAQYNMENAYYFRHYSQISQISPRVHQIQIDTVRDIVYVFKTAFAEFRTAGLMRPELYDGQMTFLAYSLMNTTSFWVYQREVIVEAKGRNPIYEILGCAWSMISPILTEKGLEIFRRKILPANAKLR